MAHDVFVSYSHTDNAVADAIVARLEQDGSRCWIAPRDIMPGTSWGDAIAAAITGSQVMVLVLSANSNRSPQVVREVERAVAGEVAILPFRIDTADPTGAMAYFLGTEHWLDAITPPMERHIERLSETVRRLLAREPIPRDSVDRAPAAVARAPRRRSSPAALAGAATVLVGAVVMLALVTGAWRPGGTLPTAAGSPGGSVGSPSGHAPSLVGLEQVGHYQPLDLDLTDLEPAGAIVGFDIDGAWLAYANGLDGVTRMAIGEPSTLRPTATYSAGDAQAVAFADDRIVAIGLEDGSLRVTTFNVDGSGGTGIPILAEGVTSASGLDWSDGFAYVASHNYVGIVDARVPAAPRMAFEWIPPGSTGNPAAVFVADGVGYFAAGWDGLYIFDLANPAAPSLLGHWTSPAWVIDVAVVDDIAYVTLGEGGVAALDLSDVSAPFMLGSVAVPGFAGPLGFAHDHAFVGWFGETGTLGGIAVVDMRDPAAPVHVKSFGRLPALSHLQVVNDHVFVSDESEGLIVFQITGLE